MTTGEKTGAGSVDLEFGSDGAVRRRVIFGLVSAMSLFVAVGGLAAHSELSGAVVASGQVRVEKDLRAIQHLDGGIIREISVSKGDQINAGDLLFTLDATQTRADLKIIESQLVELLAKRVRLLAERDGLETIEIVPGTVDLPITDSVAMKEETRLFEGNLKNRHSQREQLTSSIAQLDHEISGLQAQLEAYKDELALVQKELTRVEDLKKKGLIEDSRVYATTRDRTRLLGERRSAESSIDRAMARRNELNVSLLAIDETARTEAQKQLTEIEPRIGELEQRRAAISDRLSRMEIRSPIAGIVNEVAVNTIGGVITPAQKLLTIVPGNSELRIEVRLAPGDIDQIFVGQHAKLRFSAFAVNETPELKGTVKFVSPATTTDATTGQVYYVAEVDVSDSEMSKLDGKKLVPGMPVEAFIQTESRTVLSYLAKPMTDQFAKAFREQ